MEQRGKKKKNKRKEEKSNGGEVQSFGIRQGTLTEGEALVRLSSSFSCLVLKKH
jgi:hypothetical protein